MNEDGTRLRKFRGNVMQHSVRCVFDVHVGRELTNGRCTSSSTGIMKNGKLNTFYTQSSTLGLSVV